MRHKVIDLPMPKRPLLERMVFHGIVFNMSWEDPEMDRQAFNLGPSDTVISISSAGCNPLNFLAQRPARLISVDSNPAQNALLELKLAGIETLDHATFCDIFAARNPSVVTRVYADKLRPNISPRSQAYWDRNLWMVERDLYRYGRMGLFCRILRRFMNLMGISAAIREEFFELRTLEEQKAHYDRHFAPKLWGPWTKRFVNFRPLMWLAGVHPRQFNLIDGRHDMYEYVRERVEYAMTRVPIYDNYFLSLAGTGRFRGDRLPPYLMERNFDALRESLHKVEVVNGWLGPYLDSQPAGSITKFNLLDIFDWMTPPVFEHTLKSVLRAAHPGATMIYRSGSYRLEPPPSILPSLTPHGELAKRLLAQDRSATYGSFYVFTIRADADGVMRTATSEAGAALPQSASAPAVTDPALAGRGAVATG
ncbi:MAG: BtaA family protein [Planctomycetia bacterium]|nr:MAG: BtaA family protein [Planctomycetia bacterium]